MILENNDPYRGPSFSLGNRVLRAVWGIIYLLFFRFSPRPFHAWRSVLLKLFGAKLGQHVHVYPSVQIWAPWNLEMGAYASLGPQVDCYNQGKITIGANTIISQKTYLCASSHDYTKANFPLVLKPITIGDGVWIAADVFIGPSVNIGNYAVIAARAVLIKNVEENSIMGGNPAKFIKSRYFE
jgi:putative colanic acid biosynthesis acetyltransferase WcaF